MIILGIETSCDETAAAVVADGRNILSSVVASQIEVHHRYGGVVPELASRKHIEAIVPVVNEAIESAGISQHEIDAVAVTRGPGLIGALLVGFSFAKAFAFALDIPWVGVNHLTGHLNSVFLEPDPPPFPFVALLASGGHTSLYYVTSHIEAQVLGQTRDDAAGEAFDKVAKMLGLGYPGGGVIGRLAEQGDPEKIVFPRALLNKEGKPLLPGQRFDFSFSGLKTAVNRYIQAHEHEFQKQIPDIAAGFQEAVTDVLVHKSIQAAMEKDCNHVALVGGVAANQRLRQRLCQDAAEKDIRVHIPDISFCGDNAAMIGAVGFHYLKTGITSDIDEDVYSRVRI